jgi:NADH-quinone oxidoreductase subunit I
MRIRGNISDYGRNIYETVTTILTGMWVTFKTAFFERKVTLQYPSHDVMEGKLKEDVLFPESNSRKAFESLLGAGQRYKGPLSSKVSERYRGLLGFDDSKCIGCLQCAQICPIDVITVRAVKIEGRKAKAPLIFRIHYAKCMFCGLCVEICPTDAIFFTRQFEAATFEYRDLIKNFINADERSRRLRLADESQAKKKTSDNMENNA